MAVMLLACVDTISLTTHTHSPVNTAVALAVAVMLLACVDAIALTAASVEVVALALAMTCDVSVDSRAPVLASCCVWAATTLVLSDDMA